MDNYGEAQLKSGRTRHPAAVLMHPKGALAYSTLADERNCIQVIENKQFVSRLLDTILRTRVQRFLTEILRWK